MGRALRTLAGVSWPHFSDKWNPSWMVFRIEEVLGIFHPNSQQFMLLGLLFISYKSTKIIVTSAEVSKRELIYIITYIDVHGERERERKREKQKKRLTFFDKFSRIFLLAYC